MRSRSALWPTTAAVALVLGLAIAPRIGRTQAPPRAMSAEDVRAALRQLGYEPEGSPNSAIKITDPDGWTLNFAVGVSQNGETIWVQALLADVTDEQRVPASSWLELLKQNDAMGNPAFAFEPNKRQVWLNYIVVNRDLTAGQLDYAIKTLASSVKRTRSLWDHEW